MKRQFEESVYIAIKGTETCALHAADFMFKIYNNTLINPWVSMHLKSLLGRQFDTTKLSTGLPTGSMFYHKTGWWNYYTNDVGIVVEGKIKYIIALFAPVKDEVVRDRFKNVSQRVNKLVNRLHQ